MAVLFGNLGLLIDGTSLRTILPERKSRLLTLDLILNLPKPKPKRDSHPNPISVSYLATKNYNEPDGEIRRDGVRGRANSKSNGMDFEADDKDEGGSGKGWGEEEEEEEVVEESWEMKMRRRVTELEEEKELEEKAAELQSRMGAEGDGLGGEETEMQKRMRVRKELEKKTVALILTPVFMFCIAMTLAIQDHALRKDMVGSFGFVASIAMYGSPLVAVKLVIQTKSVEFMPFYLSFFSFLTTLLWLIYGLLSFDLLLASPNLLGVPLGTLQLVLYCIYRNKGDNLEKPCKDIERGDDSDLTSPLISETEINN